MLQIVEEFRQLHIPKQPTIQAFPTYPAPLTPSTSQSSTIDSKRSQEQSYLTRPGLGTAGWQGVTGPTNHERRNLNDSIVISPNDMNDLNQSTVVKGSHMHGNWQTSRDNLNTSVVEEPFYKIRENVITTTQNSFYQTERPGNLYGHPSYPKVLGTDTDDLKNSMLNLIIDQGWATQHQIMQQQLIAIAERNRQEEARKEQLRKDQEAQRAREEQQRKEQEAQRAREEVERKFFEAIALQKQRDEALARKHQEEENKRMEEENKEKFKQQIAAVVECDICGDNALEGQQDETLSCGHIVHAVCLRDYLSHEIRQNRKLDIPCLKCQKEKSKTPNIAQSDILNLTSWLQPDIAKISMDLLLVNDNKFKQCLTRDCKGVSGIFDGNQIECQLCKVWWCLDCKVSISFGHECAESQKSAQAAKSKQEDEDFIKTMEQRRKEGKCQKCPGCPLYIERSEACAHMTCTQCKSEFCYNCGAVYPGKMKICGCGVGF